MAHSNLAGPNSHTSDTPGCRAVVLTFPNGFTNVYEAGGIGSKCEWYSEVIPASGLVTQYGGRHKRYTQADANNAWVAVINIRLDVNQPSVPNLPRSTGVCYSGLYENDDGDSACFEMCNAGFSSGGAPVGSQCAPCAKNRMTSNNNALTFCPLIV